MNFVHAKGAIIPARIKEAFKVIGYFSYADGEVLCDGDACVISDTEEHMQIYIKKISNDGARDIIKKTRFGEIMEGLRKGASYAFDRGAYSRFFDLAKKNDISGLPAKEIFSESCPSDGMHFVRIQLVC